VSTERREYRVAFSHVDRGLHLERTLVLSRRREESLEHLTLRVLAYLLLWQERLVFGTGVEVGEEPDLVARDLTGRVETWIACGDVDPWHLQKVVKHNRDANAHVVFSSHARRAAFLAEVESWGGRRPRGWERISLWTIDEQILACLASNEALRQRWTATLAGDHFYLDADGVTCDGPVERG
jgi:uncharacterized protein YaeQ